MKIYDDSVIIGWDYYARPDKNEDMKLEPPPESIGVGVWHNPDEVQVWNELVPEKKDILSMDDIIVMCEIMRTKLEHIEQLLDICICKIK
jgi:hypothetical protein